MKILVYLKLGLFMALGPLHAFVLVEAPSFDELIGHHSGSMSTYREKELHEFRDTNVSSFLQRSSSFYLSQQGAPGSSSSAFMRGQDASSLAVYIDGVLVNDPTNPSRSFDFGHLSMAQIQKIQVYQGPQTVLHGGSALGGVVSITTFGDKKKDQGKLSYQLERYKTHDASLNYSDTTAKTTWALGLNHKSSEGYSSASSSPSGSPTPDGREFNQANFSLKSGAWRLKGHYQKDDFDLDGFDSQTSLPTDSPEDSGEDEQWQLSSLWSPQLSARLWANYLLSFKSTDRKTWQDDMRSRFEGKSWQLKLDHQWQQSSRWSAFFGFHGFWEKTVRPLDQSRRSGGFYWLQHYENSGFMLSLGARLESHQSFGENQAFSLSLAQEITPQHTLKYNFSTAYRAPSLSELFDPNYGNPDIDPETSQHHELSWQSSNKEKNLQLQSSLFATRTRSRISFDNQSLKSVNKGSSAVYGIEFKTNWQSPHLGFQFGADVTLLKAYDLETGADLLRRPRQKWGLSLKQSLSRVLSLNADLNWVSRRDEFNGDQLPQYTQVDLVLNYQVRQNFEFWSGVENIFNEPNMGAVGYTPPGVVWNLGMAKNF